MQEVLVEKLINNGYGLARDTDGQVMFLAGALPGEYWRVDEVVKRKGTWWASGIRLSDSPLRAETNCPHFGACGGCALLHIKPTNELELKLQYLRDVLSRLGQQQLDDISATDYRPQASRIRGKLHVDEQGNLGYHRASSKQVAQIVSCHVLPNSVVDLLPNLARAIKEAHFRGDVYFLTDSLGKSPVFELRGTARMGGLQPDHWQITGVAGLMVRSPEGKRLMKVGKPRVIFNWGSFKVSLPPSAFVQSNPASWPKFFELVAQYLKDWSPPRVWDTHAGSGFLSSCLAGLEVWASEPNRAAFEQLGIALRQAAFTHRIYQGTAETAIKRGFFKPTQEDGLILDPPREGLSNPLRQWIVDKGPQSLLYFSCDIASLARDLRHLGTAYRLVPPLHAMNVNPGTLPLECGLVMTRSAK